MREETKYMEYHDVGEVLTDNGIKVEVVEVDHCFCDGCAFQDTYCLEDGTRNCGSRLRLDHKNVIYRKIEEE